MKILTFDPAKQKMVLCGYLYKDTFMRMVSPQHFMNIVQGYGIQEIAFQEVLKRGISKIYLQVTTTKEGWLADTATWLEHSKIMDFGHGKQRFLSLKYMKHITNPKDICTPRPSL